MPPNLDRLHLDPGCKPTALVVLLHGSDANGHDLTDLAALWQDGLPDNPAQKR